MLDPTDPVPWPGWLADQLLGANRKDRASQPLASRDALIEVPGKRLQAFVDRILANVAKAPDGLKHDVLLRQARAIGGLMHMLDHSEDELVELVVSHLPGTVKDWAAARKTARDGLTHGARSPIQLGDRPYHLEARR